MNEVIERKVTLLGSGVAGKSSIIESLAKYLNLPVPIRQWNIMNDCDGNEVPCSPLVELIVHYNNYRVVLSTLSGSVFYRERNFKPLILATDIIVYVLAVDQLSEDSKYLYEHYFEQDSIFTQSLGKHWSQIPWIVVFNKTDLGNNLPLSVKLPAFLLKDIIYTSMYNNTGKAININKLWERIIIHCEQSDLKMNHEK